MCGSGGGILAILLAKQISCYPLGVLAQYLMVHILKQQELNRFMRPIDRLDPIDDNSLGALNEVSVEKGNRVAQLGVELALPIAPRIPIQIILRHSATAVVKGM